MNYSDVVIVSDPNLTALYVGQLISKKSLPALLEENCVTLNDIEVVPFDKALHEKYIEVGKMRYCPSLKINYSEIF